MKVKNLDHWSISTSRLEETREFFENILGLEVGPRPNLMSKGYWMYTDGTAYVHLIEKDPKTIESKGSTSESPAEGGLEDHIAFSVEDSHKVVESMKQKGIEYWDRLLPDRPLYQVFIKEPNGFVIELNDYTPALDKISPIVVYDD